MVLQLGSVEMKPFQPLSLFWIGISATCSGLTSGIIRGTSFSILWALALLKTGYSAANSDSIGPARSPGNEENTRSTFPAFSTASTVASATVISAISLGRLDSMTQLHAWPYRLPAERSEAASTSIWNHGCPCKSWMNLCPTAPVAPRMATLRFIDIAYRFHRLLELVFLNKNVNGCLARGDFEDVDASLAEGAADS